eukprot:gene15514-39612_t
MAPCGAIVQASFQRGGLLAAPRVNCFFCPTPIVLLHTHSPTHARLRVGSGGSTADCHRPSAWLVGALCQAVAHAVVIGYGV